MTYIIPLKAREIHLENIGNVAEGRPERLQVVASGRLYLPHTQMVLKLYSLRKKLKDGKADEQIGKAKVFLESQSREGKLRSYSGMGFVMLSEPVLNVCRWDSEFNDVIVPTIYTPAETNNGEWKESPVENFGAFCSREKSVYDYENKLWMSYLASGRSRANKMRYLEEFFQGKV